MGTANSGKYNTQLKNRISARDIIDMRLNGDSFNDIAKNFGISKASLYSIFLSYKSNHFDGYQPIPKKELGTALESDAPMYLIAVKYHVKTVGLINYISDYDIPSRCTIGKVEELLTTMSKVDIAAYLGISLSSLQRFIKNNGLG